MSDITSSNPTLTTDKPAGTQYVILKLREDDIDEQVYELGAQVSASSAEEAVRKGSLEKPGTYVAVPARSWQPRRVKVETVPKVTLEDA